MNVWMNLCFMWAQRSLAVPVNSPVSFGQEKNTSRGSQHAVWRLSSEVCACLLPAVLSKSCCPVQPAARGYSPRRLSPAAWKPQPPALEPPCLLKCSGLIGQVESAHQHFRAPNSQGSKKKENQLPLEDSPTLVRRRSHYQARQLRQI